MEKKPAALGTTGWCDSTNKRPHYDGEGKLSVIATHYSRNAANRCDTEFICHNSHCRDVALLLHCIMHLLHHFVIMSSMLADSYIS